MIHLVVALGCEATPLIEDLGLDSLRSPSEPFPIYVGAEARLVVSGVGAERAAAAATCLHQLFPKQPAVWLNVGVAAHRRLPLGEGIVAHKVEEHDSDRVWYPGLIVEPPFATAAVRTVDRPVAVPLGDAAYEMEAAGFLRAVLGWTTGETVAVVKVVSDHGVEHPARLDREEVTRHIARHAAVILSYARELDDLLARRGAMWRGDYLEEWLDRLHFSVTQSHQLARLANRAAALGVSREEVGTIEADNAGEWMQRLGEHLDTVAVTDR